MLRYAIVADGRRKNAVLTRCISVVQQNMCTSNYRQRMVASSRTRHHLYSRCCFASKSNKIQEEMISEADGKKYSNQSLTSRITNKISNFFDTTSDSSSAAASNLSTVPQKYSLSSIVENMSDLHKLRGIRSTDMIDSDEKLYLAARELLRRLRIGIKHGYISVNKHSIVISNLVADALTLYGDPPSSSVKENNWYSTKVTKEITKKNGRFEDSMKMMNYMKTLRLDLTPNHFAGAIRVACLEGKWDKAANLFFIQMDDFAGFVPINVTSEALEIGFYAIARSKQEVEVVDTRGCEGATHEAGSVKEILFDAANRLAIVSPMDSDGYKIAAIRALGSVGEWRECISFLNSKEGENMGHPLVAAVMDACIASRKWEEAISLYSKSGITDYESTGMFSAAVENVYNATLQAYGLAPTGYSNAAKELFDSMLKNQIGLRPIGLVGLCNACEKDQDWNSIGYILETSLKTVESHELLPFMSSKLTMLVMRAWNFLGKHDQALVHGYAISRECHDGRTKSTQVDLRRYIIPDSQKMRPLKRSAQFTSIDTAQNGDMQVRAADLYDWKILLSVGHIDEGLLIEIMKALSGLSPIRAVALYEGLLKRSIGELMSSWNDARNLYEELKSSADQYNLSNSNFEVTPMKLEILLNFVDEKLISPSCLQIDCSEILSKFALANHASVGLFLIARHRGFHDIKEFLKESGSEISANDEVFAAYLETLRLSGLNHDALSIYFENMDQENIFTWKTSLHECFKILVELSEPSKIVEMLTDMPGSSSSDFSQVGQVLLTSENYGDVLDVFRLANHRGKLSDELGLHALQATCRLKNTEKRRIFSGITKAMDWELGMTEGSWLQSNQEFIVSKFPRKDWAKVFQWPSSQKNLRKLEFDVAYECLKKLKDQVRDDARLGTLIAVVETAGYQQRYRNCRGKPKADLERNHEDYKRQKFDRRVGIDVVQEAVSAAEEFDLMNDSEFILKVAMALRALRGDSEVVDFVKKLITSNPNNLSEMTFVHGVACAEQIGDFQMKNRIIDIMEAMGYAYIPSKATVNVNK